ncbi:MAG: hypothetical protein D9V44_08855 [Actinobacteria bacterium]|nr:MAG: hypothetical protein D9V44_08855 [Actinomycetota bacterium]
MELMSKVCKSEEMNFERLAARIFVAGGGVFWIAAVLGMDLGYRDKGVFGAAQTALIPLAIAAGALAIGWFYENLAAAVLLGGTVGTVVWGIASGWEGGVWWVMTGVLIGPMAIAALLFFLAARMQRICELRA